MGPLTKRERHVMEHACGLTYSNKTPFYRNYFAANPDGGDAAVWDGLVERGLAEVIGQPSGTLSHRYYAVTTAGAEMIKPRARRRRPAQPPAQGEE